MIMIMDGDFWIEANRPSRRIFEVIEKISHTNATYSIYNNNFAFHLQRFRPPAYHYAASLSHVRRQPQNAQPPGIIYCSIIYCCICLFEAELVLTRTAEYRVILMFR